MVRMGAWALTWTVLSLPLRGQAAPADLAAAQTALLEGQPKVALEHLEAEHPTLPDWRALLRGRALAADGRAELAVQSLKSVDRVPKVSVPCAPTCSAPAYPLAQEALAELVPPADGAKILLALPPSGPRLLRAMELAQIAKDPKLEHEAERRLLISIPDSLEARRHAEVLGASQLAARLETRDRRLERTRQLLETHQSEAAYAEAKALTDGATPSEACELRYIMAKSARKMRKYPLALESLSAGRKLCRTAKSEDFERRLLLLEAQVRGIRGEPASLAKVVRELEAHHPNHSFIDDALFLLAETESRAGQEDRAEKSYRRIVDEFPEGDHAIEAGWRLAYRAYRRGQPKLARPLLIRGVERAKGSREAARASYWLGRLSEGAEGAEGKEVCPHYEKAAFEPPLTFYTWLALSRAEAKLPDCGRKIRAQLEALQKEASKTETLSAQLHHHPQAVRARQLAELGFQEEAVAELVLLEDEKLSLEDVINLAFEYDEVAGHREAQWLLRTRAKDALNRTPRGGDRVVWLAAYSKPYWPEIEKAAGAMKLDPLLLLALVREESTFDPEIVSWAGATGLAQLMPGTAMTAYADLKRGRLDPERLFEPELNVELGAYVLRSGFRRFEQQAPLALAAYNGGAGLAAKTLPSESDYPFDRWVEEIFVKETRLYVMRVMGTYGIYRFLYEPEAPLLTLPLTVPRRRGG